MKDYKSNDELFEALRDSHGLQKLSHPKPPLSAVTTFLHHLCVGLTTLPVERLNILSSKAASWERCNWMDCLGSPAVGKD